MDRKHTTYSFGGLKAGSARNRTSFRRVPELDNLEVLHALYTNQSFSPHYHDGHVIGVIENGALGFDYRGEKLVASAGQINIADPGEVHNGFSVTDHGWQYRMFYLPPGYLEKMCRDISGHAQGTVFFKKGVIQDQDFALTLQRLHMDFCCREVSLLELQSRFLRVFASFVSRHTRPGVTLPDAGQEKRAVTLARDYIHNHFDSNISLDDLSACSGLSRYYFLRVFQHHTGLTPHAYLNQIRCSHAKSMLDNDKSISQAALDTGFFDQSHLNRVFKKIYGITPGQYRNSIQDSNQ